MKTFFIALSKLALVLCLISFLSSCEEQEFFKKEYLKGVAEHEQKETDKNLDDQIDDDTLPTGTGTIEPDPDTPIVDDTIPEGSGNDDPPAGSISVEDQFIQKGIETQKVDILWVVDNSGSMQNEQVALAYNFEIFIRDFITKDVDFKMGITTTDPRPDFSGKMINPVGSLTSIAAKNDEAQFILDFENHIQVGINGFYREMGMFTADSFFTKNGQTFLRDDAYLIIVMISDEEDQSGSTASNYVSKFKALKQNAGMVKIYSIVNTNEAGYSVPETKVGKRYIEASNLTAGVVGDIQDDFHTILDNMGGKIINLIDSFALSKQPIISSIEVFVDGLLVTAGWNYDDSSRTIMFDNNSLPEEGKEIKVKYLHSI